MRSLVTVVLLLGESRLGSAVACAQDGSDYSYSESVSGATRTITTNHCPNHPYYNLNPNTAVKSVQTYTVPASPVFKGTATDKTTSSANIDLSQKGGGVGVLFNGAFLFSPYGGSRYGQVTSFANSATYAEGNTFDQCGCHGSKTDAPSYHCHVPPHCLLRQLGQTSTAHSPQIGWAHDGFPIYGPRGPGGTMMKTCTQTGGTYGTDVCTDDCGGYYKSDGSIDKFVYRYYILGDYNDGTSCDLPGCPSPGASYYPNTPVCYRGCCPAGVTCQSWISACPGSGTLNGYTNGYSAAVPTINSLPLASGLPSNPDACKCSDLACKTPCSSSNWASSSCGGGSTSNTCPSGGTAGSSTGTASFSTRAGLLPVLAVAGLVCAIVGLLPSAR